MRYKDVLGMIKQSGLRPSTKSKLKGLGAGALEFAKYMVTPSNWNKARNTAVNSMLRGVINLPGTVAAGIAGPLPGLGGPGLGGVVAKTWENHVTDNILPKSTQRKELEASARGLATINNLIQDATGTAILAKGAPYGGSETMHTHHGTPYKAFSAYPGWGSAGEVAAWAGSGNALKSLTLGQDRAVPKKKDNWWRRGTQWVADHL